MHDVFTLSMASSYFGQSRLVAECHCLQWTHFSVRVLLSLHWMDACLPAQYLQVLTSDLHVLAWWPNFCMAVEALQWFSCVRSHPVTSASPCKSGWWCCFPERTTFIMFVGVVVCVCIIHFVILDASSTSSSCNSSFSVIYDGTPIMM